MTRFCIPSYSSPVVYGAVIWRMHGIRSSGATPQQPAVSNPEQDSENKASHMNTSTATYNGTHAVIPGYTVLIPIQAKSHPAPPTAQPTAESADGAPAVRGLWYVATWPMDPDDATSCPLCQKQPTHSAQPRQPAKTNTTKNLLDGMKFYALSCNVCCSAQLMQFDESHGSVSARSSRGWGPPHVEVDTRRLDDVDFATGFRSWVQLHSTWRRW
jgi:hypothetical protein